MAEHRDDSKAEFQQGRTGNREPGGHSRVSRPDQPIGGYGVSPSPAYENEDDMPAEERTFSQSGGSGSQPGMAKRLATDEEEDLGHLKRASVHGKGPSGRPQDRRRGRLQRGADAQ